MRRSAALAGIALAPLAAVSACAPSSSGIAATTGSPLHPTAFGSQIYPSDDVGRTVSLLAACGARLLRVDANNDDFAYFDALFAATAAHGMRLIVISEYASQPVDLSAYAANAAGFHRRYAPYDPIWELWNEPNLAYYWRAPADVDAYAKLAIATATALRAAGARDVLSGGTSGVDVNWLYGLRARGVFGAVTGCAVHSYKNPRDALNEYLQARSLMPPGVAIHTTEACVVDSGGQPSFFRDMWYLHRYLGLPALVWCEFRDGTAGSAPPYTDPMGLVTSDYERKPVYYTAQSLVGTPIAA
jgi:polysaccharide biosynthesis protein PslG